MKTIKTIMICVVLLMALAGCSFKNADSAKSSMQEVNQSADDLKSETQSAKKNTEEMKEQESHNSTQGYQW